MYFHLPLRLRVKIRQKLSQNSLYTTGRKVDLPEKYLKIPALLFTEEHLNVDLCGSMPEWSFSGLEKSRSVFNLDPASNVDSTFITFDVWDTLIGRFRPAEAVKYSSALYISISDWRNNSYIGKRAATETIYLSRNESEAHQVRAHGECQLLETLNDIREKMQLNFSILSAFEFELNDEIKRCYPIPNTVKALEEFNGEKLLVSDFHVSSEHLNYVLNGLGIKLDQKAIHSSSDYLVTKRNNGELFIKLGCDIKSNWIHVGDNPLSDWENSQKLGSHVIKVHKESTNAWHQHAVEAEKLALDFTNFLGGNEVGRYLIDLATISFALCSSAIELAISKGRSKVVYVSREGETLLKAHKSLYDLNFFAQIPIIAGIHFPVSRTAIVMASWADSEEAGLKEISIQYPIMDTTALIETLGLPHDLREHIYASFSPTERFRTEEAWNRIKLEGKIAINSYLRLQRDLIRKFIENEGITPNEVVICDLGWRGSIQDAMQRIVGDPYIGQYLGLYKPFNSNVFGEKHGLVFDETRGLKQPTYMNLLGPIERAFTISPYQVVRYQQNGELVTPVYHEVQEGQNEARTKLMHNSFPDIVAEVSETLISIGLFGSESSKFAGFTLKNWYLNPNHVHASVWFDEEHREGYGAGDSVHYAIEVPSRKWIGKSIRQQVIKNASSSLWIDGYLAWLPINSLIERTNPN